MREDDDLKRATELSLQGIDQSSLFNSSDSPTLTQANTGSAVSVRLWLSSLHLVEVEFSD